MSFPSADELVAACADESADAGVTIRTVLEPLAGDGAPVKPATYAGGVFQHGRRWWGEDGDRRPVDILVVDNEPSQANRLEAALGQRREEFGLPEIVLDLSAIGSLPPHLPGRISSFQFPHRNADAYLRDSLIDGARFITSEIGRAVFDATADRPEALLQWCPQALLYGFWQSHLGKKRSQAKLARAWTSEIIGVEPAIDDVRRLGLKGDPLNLSVTDPVAYSEVAHDEWGFSAKGKKLADIGHGQVPVSGDDAALAGVSFRSVVQQSTVSFPSLRRIRA
ncbi:MAG TPA: type I-U CRISPR-associated RAMP protein Csb1/Cas7u, partial [Acidimicrobiales bacterium]|nr:type I-U CRISPR-associated RAMP protein Csb1/Cas7u [Acidimicrobiales bacterium]